MSRKRISFIALLLAVTIILGVFVSCNNTEETTTQGTDSEQTTETATNADTESSTEKAEGSETTQGSSTETETSEVETSPSEIEDIIVPGGKDGELIVLSNKLANTVDTYYSDSLHKSVIMQNSNMALQYNMVNSSNMLVSNLSDPNGKSYVKDTMDVFVTMKNGNTYYASMSNKQASLNIYRYGYYYYENRIEGQSFINQVKKLDETKINHLTYKKYNDLADTPVKANGTLTYYIDGNDPWISYTDLNFSTDKYDYIEVTLRAENVTSSAQAFIVAGSKSWFTADQSVSFELINDGEFHTYQVPLKNVPDYTGNVRALRLDINCENGSKVEISGIKAFKSGTDGTPSDLTLQRSFITYSDKLHHIIQIAAYDKTENIEEIGMLTEIDANTVAKLIVKDKNGLKESLDGVDWASAEYIGFDIKDVGIFGYILPCDNKSGSLSVTLENGVYAIKQAKAPENGTIIPSDENTLNANDFFMGQRIYTDGNHDFKEFLKEAKCERNPLSKENFSIDEKSSDNGKFAGYDALRGYYKFTLSGTGFNEAYNNYPNKQYRVSFSVTGDSYDRNMYFMTYTSSGNLESAAILNADKMLLPVPLEVAKNFKGDGENTIYNLDDASYGEVYFPMIVKAGETKEYTLLNLYQNWGLYPLKQISSIQFFVPYYHLSTGVTETNCIVQLPSTGPGLPDHRAMSAPFWKSQPQHNSAGTHNFLRYTDSDGHYSGSDNTGTDIDSYGPTYCDLTLGYVSSDGKIEATYTHTEMPQTDENRAFYELKYTVLEDITFKDFAHDFIFYSVTDNNPTGTYKKVGYLDENNECQVVASYQSSTGSQDFVLGNECPYFSFFDMPDYDPNASWIEGYSNLSFLIYNAEFTIGGEKAEPNFILVNTLDYLKLSLDLGEVTLKAGDTFTINAILMPWGSQESDYSGEEPDFNVREVRRNTLLNPLKPTANKDCEVTESVFVPKLRTTNGKSAEFTLSGGNNNVAVRIYGFDKLTVPTIEEYVDGEWKEYAVNSVNNPDAYGFGHYYDGYMVHYDGDGTYSYSFVTEMDNGQPRKFRISAAEDFEGWPEEEIVEKAPDPINVYVDSSELINLSVGNSFISSAELADDGSYVRFYGKEGIPEAYIEIYSASTPEYSDITSTGQYFVFKYRSPKGLIKLNSFEFFTSTANSSAVDGDNIVIHNISNDNEWHVVIVDLSKRLSSFKANDSGEYFAKYFRFDFFNQSVSNEMYIDFAYMGLSDSFEDIISLNADMENVLFVDGSKTIIIDTKTGEEYVAPEISYIDPSSGYVKSSVAYYAMTDMINGMGGDATHFTGRVSRSGEPVMELDHNRTTIAGSKLVLSGWTVANGGIEKYVWSADGGKTWHDMVSYNGRTAGEAGQAHLDILSGVVGGTPVAGSTSNAVYQGPVGTGADVTGLAADLSDYVGQTVNVTFAAIPKAEPNSLCIIIHVNNVQVIE